MIGNQLIYVSFFVFFIITSIFIIKSLIIGYELNLYLKNNYDETWSRITCYNKSLGRGSNNPFRYIPYIYGDKDNDDKNILRYKEKVKNNLHWAIIFFLICFIHLIIL